MGVLRDRLIAHAQQEQPIARQDHQDHQEILDHRESRDHGEWTEDLAPTVSASLLALEAEEDASNAHLGHRDHQAQVDHQDRLVRQVDKDLQVQEPAAWDLRDHLVHLETQDHQECLETWDLLEHPARMEDGELVHVAHQDHLDPQVHPADQVQMVQWVCQERQDRWDHRDQLVVQDLQASLDPQDRLEQQERQVTMHSIALAHQERYVHIVVLPLLLDVCNNHVVWRDQCNRSEDI